MTSPTIPPIVTLTARRVVHYKTAGRALAAVGRGSGRFFIWYHKWITAADKEHLIAAGSSAANKAAHDHWCHLRQRTAAIVSLLALFVVAFGYVAAGPIAPTMALLMLMAGLGRWGRVVPVMQAVDAVPHKVVIRDETIKRVIASAVQGIKPEEWEGVRVLGQGVTWDVDHVWWSCRVELPGTIHAEAVKAALPKLMSGLGVGPSQLIVTADPTNNGVVTITGTDTDPWLKPSAETPMAELEATSVWDPIPIATTLDDGRRILVSLVFTGWLIGAIPRMGKTNYQRLLALWCALDPMCDLIVFDLKGGADWRMFDEIAIAFGLGHTDATIVALMDRLVKVQAEIDRRAEVLGNLPIEQCPEGQLTRALATDPEMDLNPIVIFIDEVQWALAHHTYGRRIVALLENIVKGGQYVGVWLVLATQRPDRLSVPTQIRDVLGTRSAGPCMTRQSSETILGTQAYSEGFNAAALPRRAGSFIVYGADDTAGLMDAVTVKVDRGDIALVTAVARRSVGCREKLGRLPRQRTKVEPAIVRLARQIQGERAFVPAAELLATLNDLPEYEETPFNKNTLGNALRRAGYQSFQMKKDVPEELRNRMGYNLQSTD